MRGSARRFVLGFGLWLAAVGTAAAAQNYDGSWVGMYRCLAGPGGQPPFAASVRAEIVDGTIRLERRWPTGSERLTGTISDDGSVRIRGSGADGAGPTFNSFYTGKADNPSMINVSGYINQIRSCEITLASIAPASGSLRAKELEVERQRAEASRQREFEEAARAAEARSRDAAAEEARRQQTDAEVKRKAEAEAKRQADETRKKAEAEARAKAEAEARVKAEAELQRMAEALKARETALQTATAAVAGTRPRRSSEP